MDKITVDERNKKRIQRHIKQEIAFYGGYEQDIELLEQNGELTEALAMKVFIDVLNDAHRIRTILEPEENDEFQDLMDEVYSKYDAIPKPRDLEVYGYYDGGRINYMNFDEVYSFIGEMDSDRFIIGNKGLRSLARNYCQEKQNA